MFRLGTYGIFGRQIDNEFELYQVRVYPNPYRPNDEQENTGTLEGGIVFDRMPEDVEDIKIYNVAGDLVATKDNAIKFYSIEELADIQDNYTLGLDTYPDLFGAVAVWMADNDAGKKVASGLYIAVFTASNGDSQIRKLVIIR